MENAERHPVKTRIEAAQKDLEASVVAMKEAVDYAAATHSKRDTNVARSIIAKQIADMGKAKAIVSVANVEAIQAKIRYKHASKGVSEKKTIALRAAKDADDAEEVAYLVTKYAATKMDSPEFEEEARIAKAHAEELQSVASAERFKSIAAYLSLKQEVSELEVAQIELETANRKILWVYRYLEYSQLQVCSEKQSMFLYDLVFPISDAHALRAPDIAIPVESNNEPAANTADSTVDSVSQIQDTFGANPTPSDVADMLLPSARAESLLTVVPPAPEKQSGELIASRCSSNAVLNRSLATGIDRVLAVSSNFSERNVVGDAKGSSLASIVMDAEGKLDEKQPTDKGNQLIGEVDCPVITSKVLSSTFNALEGANASVSESSTKSGKPKSDKHSESLESTQEAGYVPVSGAEMLNTSTLPLKVPGSKVSGRSISQSSTLQPSLLLPSSEHNEAVVSSRSTIENDVSKLEAKKCDRCYKAAGHRNSNFQLGPNGANSLCMACHMEWLVNFPRDRDNHTLLSAFKPINPTTPEPELPSCVPSSTHVSTPQNQIIHLCSHEVVPSHTLSSQTSPGMELCLAGHTMLVFGDASSSKLPKKYSGESRSVKRAIYRYWKGIACRIEYSHPSAKKQYDSLQKAKNNRSDILSKIQRQKQNVPVTFSSSHAMSKSALRSKSQDDFQKDVRPTLGCSRHSSNLSYGNRRFDCDDTQAPNSSNSCKASAAHPSSKSDPRSMKSCQSSTNARTNSTSSTPSFLGSSETSPIAHQDPESANFDTQLTSKPLIRNPFASTSKTSYKSRPNQVDKTSNNRSKLDTQSERCYEFREACTLVVDLEKYNRHGHDY